MSNYRIVSPSEYNVTPKRNSFISEIGDVFASLDFIEKLVTELGITEQKTKTPSKHRDVVDGSFIVVLDPIGFPELAQRIINYADKSGLTINPSIKNAKVGDSLIFGSDLKYDVNLVKTSKTSGVEELYEGNRSFGTQYFLTNEFPQILNAIDGMVGEYNDLLTVRALEVLSGKRADKPTYFELKQDKVGQRLISKKREENLTKELNSIKTGIGCPCVKQRKVDQTVTVGYNFIQVGTNLIPVNDNQTVYLSV